MSPENQDQKAPSFKFLSYSFDKRKLIADFCYQGVDNVIFNEKVVFAKNPDDDRIFNVLDKPELNDLLDRTLFLAFIALGTTYYLTHPTPNVEVSSPLDEFQAYYFNKIYQEGLSQLALENNLNRDNLAHFSATPDYRPKPAISYSGEGIISLQSGGKDSLLTATMLNEQELKFTPWYLSDDLDYHHPTVIDNLGAETTQNRPATVAARLIDENNLRLSNGLTGHTPDTLIFQSLALVQAVLFNKNTILTSISQEGTEPIAIIGDLPINHQWSKTWEAEHLFAEYVRRYISPDIISGSPIRHLSELYSAELFVKKCWPRYGFTFSSCKNAAYLQFSHNTKLPWCGKCPRCANTYLLFSPFLPPTALQALFSDKDLFLDEELYPSFMGLLGVGNMMKPLESVGSVNELRTAYQSRQEAYTALPFLVPPGDFDYRATYPVQDRIIALFER